MLELLKSKEIKVGIISSILASLIFIIFFNPVITFLWDKISLIGLDVFENYNNSLYKYSVQNGLNIISSTTFSIVFSLYFLFFLFVIVYPLWLKRKTKQDKKDQRYGDIVKNAATKKDITSTLVELEIKARRLNFYIIFLKVIYVMIIIISLLWMSNNVLKTSMCFTVNNKIETKIQIVSPYITEHREKELISEWKQIASQKDYKDLNTKLDSIARDNKIVCNIFK